MNFSEFKKTMWDYYRQHGRQLPWRETHDPYSVLVSEVMLQQTQVSRVVPKYERFIKELPTLEALSSAPLPLVLELWSGLGYNRRAKYLHDAARALVGIPLPWQPADLIKLKGIGPNTAAAVCVYAFNQPHVFIETNIRSVFLHHFSEQLTGNSEQDAHANNARSGFPPMAERRSAKQGKLKAPPALFGVDPAKIYDKDLLPLIESALDRADPRTFYWALMDYGSYLKSTVPNPSRASAHHARQSVFAGSVRELRGQVLRYMLAVQKTTRRSLLSVFEDARLESVLQSLINDGLLMKSGAAITVATSSAVVQ